MPNHIKNRITIIGTDEQVKEVLSKFSSFHPKALNKTHDKSQIICDNSEGNFCGWFNESDNTFTYSSDRKTKITGLPKGVQYEYNEEFIRFPDFNKIFPMPEDLNIDIHSGIETAVKRTLKTKISSNPLLASLEMYNRDECKSPLTFNKEEWSLFIKALNNVYKYGYAFWYDWHVEHWGTKWNSYECKRESNNVFTFETAWTGIPRIIAKISDTFPDITFDYEYSDEDIGSNCGCGSYTGGVEKLTVIESGSKEAYELAFKLRPDRKCHYKLVDGSYEYNEDIED